MLSIQKIEDEVNLLSLLTRIFELEGYQVFRATTGQSLIKLLSKESVDVILTDVRLPDISSLDLLPQLEEKILCAEVVVMTAYCTIAPPIPLFYY